MSFGPSYLGMHKRAAYFVDKILKGTKAADLPMEQPTKFELIIHLKTQGPRYVPVAGALHVGVISLTLDPR